MYRIHCVIAEDIPLETRRLIAILRKYEEKRGIILKISEFSDGSSLLDEYPSDTDILFLDIEMRPLDGLSAARKIRSHDSRVIIVFVTNLIQFALEGYKVDAMDFLVKPVGYTELEAVMDRAFRRLEKRRREYLILKTRDTTHRCRLDEIYYVETYRHHVIVHLSSGDLDVNETMAAIEEKLKGCSFFRCHAAFLVNLMYVQKLGINDVLVAGKTLAVSRHRRKDFVAAIADYMGE